jgi:UDP-N-acetylmuramoylalanine--D-glutamate ligase
LKPRPAIPEGPYLVVGLARSGIAAALMLRGAEAEVIGVDGAAPTGTAALADAGVQVILRDDGVAQLEHVRTVVKSPGVPAQAPVIAAARARGLTVLGELELAWRMLSNDFIAVTGTNGKTTTVELIGHIHREAGMPVEVAGNVGTALSGLVGAVDPGATIVCEASSFQLEDTLAFAPEAAVLLNVTPDHMDRHPTMDDYLAAKLQVFARQGEQDVAVLPRELASSALGGDGRRVYFDEMAGLPVDELRLPGAHNLQNAMAAAAVCLARGMDLEDVRNGLRSFAGVAHRLEEVVRRNGVLYVNDSKATNVASTLVALDALPDLPIHLILGGQGKGQDFSELRGAVARSCKAVYLIGEDAPAIARALRDSGVPVYECGDLERAVAMAAAAAAAATEAAADADADAAAGADEVILLSPGCASFDQFADFEARGERFRELVL